MNILFDMDGVLVDSEPVIAEAAILGLREYGISPVAEDFRPFIGTGEDRFIGGVAEKYGLEYKVAMKKRVYEIYLEIVNEKIGLFDRTVEVLQELNNSGHICVLASSADRIKIDANLKAAGIDPVLFKAIIGGEDVNNKKPAPDIYLKAANTVGASSADCLVVEDAVNGIQAATAAGMLSVGVTTSFSEAVLKTAGAEYIIKSLTELKELVLKKA